MLPNQVNFGFLQLKLPIWKYEQSSPLVWEDI